MTSAKSQSEPMPFAVDTHSYTFGHSIDEALNDIARAHYVEVELLLSPGHLWPSETDAGARRQIRRVLRELGLNVVAINIPNGDLNITGAAVETRDYTLGILEAAAELGADLDAAYLVMGPGKGNPLLPGPKEELVDRLYAALDRLSPRAQDLGLSICIENVPYAYVPDVAGLMETVDGYGDDSIGTVYDLANGYFIGEDLCAGLRRQADRLRLIHVSDTTRARHRHDAVGTGEVRLGDLPPVLSEIGYSGRPVLEIISRDPTGDIARSADVLIGLGWGGARPTPRRVGAA